MSVAYAPSAPREVRPQPGPQAAFLSTKADIAVYGGAAGGGKTWALLMEPLRHISNPHFGAVIFRRTSVQVRNEGGLWDESVRLYPDAGGKPKEYELWWKFPSGSSVTFAHLEHDKNALHWQGSQIALLCFDELTHFSEYQFWYMVSRNRSTCGVRPYIRATCLAGDEIVICGDGALLRVDAVTTETHLLSTRMRDSGFFTEPPSAIYEKTSKTLRILTNRGEHICTPEHKWFRWSKQGPEEITADSLKEGDYLASTRRYPHGIDPIDEDYAYLVGYTAGDGGVTGRDGRRIMWTEGSPAHANYVAAVAHKVLGEKIGVHARTTVNATSVYTTAVTASATAFIEANESVFVASSQRAIPAYICAGDRAAVKAVLQGLFDSEGYIFGNRIGITTVSRQLMRQVAILLRRWGIVATYDTRLPSPPRQRYYRLSLSGDQAQKFVDLIGFRMTRKQEDAIAATDLYKNSEYRYRCSDADLIPVNRPSIEQLKPFFGKSWWNTNKALRRETVDRVLEEADKAGVNPGVLKDWSLFTWERIKSVVPDKERQVFDLTMPTEHTFFTDCTISHNCNPDADSWVAEFLEWWINPDTGYPIPERAGVLRWFIRLGDRITWADSPDDLANFIDPITGNPIPPKSVTFIPGMLTDNKVMTEADPGYSANLMALPPVERERLLRGNWKIRATGTQFFTLSSLLENGKPIGFPRHCDSVFAILDTALKSGKEHDGTAVVWASKNSYDQSQPVTILDWEILSIDGAMLDSWLPSVFSRGEELASECRARNGFLGAWIEDKASGIVLLQQSRIKNLQVFPIESKLTAIGKDERALAISPWVSQGKVKLSEYAFHKTMTYKNRTMNHLIRQIETFVIADENNVKRADDLLDAWCYAVHLALGDD